MTGTTKVQIWDDLKWQDVHTNFLLIDQTDRKLLVSERHARARVHTETRGHDGVTRLILLLYAYKKCVMKYFVFIRNVQVSRNTYFLPDNDTV
jgi:hypothetical protein